MPTEKAMQEALEIIQDLALEIQIDHELSSEVEERLDLIIALAKHGFDIRTTQEKEKMDEWKKREIEAGDEE